MINEVWISYLDALAWMVLFVSIIVSTSSGIGMSSWPDFHGGFCWCFHSVYKDSWPQVLIWTVQLLRWPKGGDCSLSWTYYLHLTKFDNLRVQFNGHPQMASQLHLWNRDILFVSIPQRQQAPSAWTKIMSRVAKRWAGCFYQTSFSLFRMLRLHQS